MLLELLLVMYGWLDRSLRPNNAFLSTPKATRTDMKTWVLSGEGDKWTVTLDVREVGHHLDTTSKAATLATWVPCGLSKVETGGCSGFLWERSGSSHYVHR